MRYAALTLALASTVLGTAEAQSGSYPDLLALFREWREFQKPKLIDGAPDYGASAMAAQKAELDTIESACATSTRPAGPSRTRSTTTSCAPR
jgi:hypothetical protein